MFAKHVAAKALGAVITGPFRGANGARTYKQHVIFTAIRSLTASLSVRLLGQVHSSILEIVES